MFLYLLANERKLNKMKSINILWFVILSLKTPKEHTCWLLIFLSNRVSYLLPFECKLLTCMLNKFPNSHTVNQKSLSLQRGFIGISVFSLAADHLWQRGSNMTQVAHPTCRFTFCGMIRQQAQSRRKQRMKLLWHQPSHWNNKYAL